MKIETNRQQLELAGGLRQSAMHGTTFKQVVLATPCMDTYNLCSQSLNITEYGEKPTNFGDMRLNFPVSHLRSMRIHLLPLFAARVTMVSYVTAINQSARRLE
jgi:hypothetical protein